MKKLLLTSLAAVAAVGVILAAGNHYQSYQNTKNQEDAKIAAAVASVEKQRNDQLNSALTSASKLSSLYNAAITECQKGKLAYDKLSPTVKVQVPAPTCGKPL